MTGFEDEGSIVTDSVHAHSHASPIVGTASTVRTFIGQHGSLTIRLQSMIEPTDNPDLYTESGSWVVLETTGAYAGVDGWGKEAGVRDFAHQSLDVTYRGLALTSLASTSCATGRVFVADRRVGPLPPRHESGQVLAPGRTKVLDFGALAAHRPRPDTKNRGAPCR